MKKHLSIFTLLFIYTCINLVAQEIPPIQNFTSNLYKAENQNWAITQTEDKHIIVANNKGLLEYDGARWNLSPSPNNSIIRSVYSIDSLIYSGSNKEFGVWQKNKFGLLKYTSLSHKIESKLLEDEEFWNILKFEHWILFQSLNRIYIYDTLKDEFNIIDSKTILQKAFNVNGNIYFQKVNDGLYKIENGKPMLLSDDQIIKQNVLVDIYGIGKKTLLLTQENGFFELSSEGKLNKWTTPNESLFSSISIYSSHLKKDGTFLLGTIAKGIYHIDKNGALLSNLNQENGLNNNTVLTIFEDTENNIWLGLDNGISVVNLNSPIKVYNDPFGKLGTVYASAIKHDILYLGTNQGLFYKPVNANSSFKLIAGTKGQVWCLKEIDTTLFCGHNQGTFIINDTIANKISDTPGTWDLKKVPSSNSLIIQGNYTGLTVLEKTGGYWKFKNKIEGFTNSARYFEFLDKNKIIINHELKGIFEVTTDNHYNKIKSTKLNDKFKGHKSGLISYNNELLYFYPDGIYKYDPTENAFKKHEQYSKNVLDNENYISGKLIKTDNKLWVFTDKSIGYFSPGNLNNIPQFTKISFPASARRDFAGFESVTHIKNQRYLFGNSTGYLVIDLDKYGSHEFYIQLNSFHKIGKQVEHLELKNNQLLKSTENHIDFSYSIPTYNKYTEITYQYKLKGIYENWSNWTTSPKTKFENLPFGEYEFIVRAKVGNKLTKNMVSLSFTIDRPWYLSNRMLGLYLFAITILFIGIHNIYKQYFKRQKKSLLDKKQRELERVQLENEREIMKLRNDKLRGDIDSKNRELAASTMSIIKKNEFLNTIKKELSDVKNNELVKPVIKIIDKNLNHTSDWEYFQEAFNNADKDFLKKVKTKHDNLTPNDLRLCAYLRLNLSSKEIAPLLNISHKSVEIKRYRLRKKMGLTTKDNLIHHILEI
ncbi:helix-turn-helix and ligand-binding sensor domain-containing protein [Flavicella sediminum]|uniref:helix-turn-helix and ligand-binding sensor domain-containing protein n=1 Tax=Flavicella sediminum TaxID=2585141 RepID=UPI001FB5B5EE|nr:triple tyrosine motif-containing protein [Flavicella sediminum]